MNTVSVSRKHCKINTDTGFSLVEMAIVLLIIGLLLGTLLSPLSSQFERDQRKAAQTNLQEMKQALLGFALANDRLPCPATPNSVGAENPIGGGACNVQHGFIPATTLGLSGGKNGDNLLLDPWSNPYRYSITNSNTSAFTTVNSMSITKMAVLAPDISVCTTTAGSTANNCANIVTTLTSNAVAAIYSMGKEWASTPVSPEQQENQGTTLGGGPLGINYPIANDIVFVDRDYSNAVGIEFDDILIWISPNILYNRLVSGGRLP